MAEPGHVVLVGMMGAGKSSVGRRVARRLQRPFVDADDELEARTGRSVRGWFAEGEPAFRKAEADVLAALLARPEPTVMATGGGVVVAEANRRALTERAFVVWLDADPAFLASRVRRRAHRPLLDDAGAGDATSTLARLHAERTGWYRQVADAVIDVAPVHQRSSRPKGELADQVADLVRRHEAGVSA